MEEQIPNSKSQGHHQIFASTCLTEFGFEPEVVAMSFDIIIPH
jgi:hypothetical protein